MAGRTLPDQTSDYLDLQAMLRALLSADLLSIHIITDNEPVCNLVNKLLLKPNGRGVQTMGSMERQIREGLKDQLAKGLQTKCSQIFSHIEKKQATRGHDKRWQRCLEGTKKETQIQAIG